MATDTKTSDRTPVRISTGSAELSDSDKERLRKNPFTTYRDPQTGRWIVVKPVTA